ncbi:hypothetical protein SLEP1_g59504 [Rubroshorea leprosula]|uniref:Uncharacterized protein n=1 Tax=Rubroshorea leprosula TaxID=152421 RepID=A0AAV5MV14_9ROSI|nr:hypothetical protein SLEP1_g59504 [Rubroshorea leprosula]
MSASFKSSSRKGNLSSSSSKISTDKESKAGSPKKASLRRSRSVSAFSRNQSDVCSEFLIKRDNPLFCNSPSDDETEGQKGVKVSKSEDYASFNAATKAKSEDRSRGRSISRKADVGKHVSGTRKELGRSLSVVDTAARRSRSMSRRPVSRGYSVISETEVERQGNMSRKLMNRNNNCNSASTSSSVKRGVLSRSNSSLSDQIEGLRSRSQLKHFDTSGGSPRRFDLSSMKSANWEDAVSTSSLSEADDMSFKAASEQMKSIQEDSLVEGAPGIYESVRSEVRRAISDIQNDLKSAIQRSNTTATGSTSLTDLPPDLVSPVGIELVSDMKREYAKKLEQSEERARKLRAELAVEEQRGMELSRILKEELQEPRTPSLQKSRAGKNSSIERRKISKTLTEEAMAYFDECVSLSTFDSADFSSLEDPPLNMVGGTTLESNSISLRHANTGILATNCSHNHLNDNQEYCFIHGDDALDLTASTSGIEGIDVNLIPNSINRERGRRFQFSFSSLKPSETSELQQDIKKYVKTLEKGIKRVDIDSPITISKGYDPDEYNLRASREGLLFDHVLFKNRLESGGMLLCGGSVAISLSPFASVI